MNSICTARISELCHKIRDLRSMVFTPNRQKRACYGFRDWRILKILDYPQIIENLFGIKTEFLASMDALGCISRCHYCWVPKENEDEFQTKFYSSDEICEKLLNLKGNVWRITGGEPLVTPEIVFEILDRLHSCDLAKVFWLETNLLPIIVFPHVPKALSAYKKLVVHCSIKGADRETFKSVTGLSGELFPYTLKALKALIDQRVEVFPSFLANAVPPEKLNCLFKELLEIHPKLPLRVMIRRVLPYKATVCRLRRFNVRLYSFQECLRVWDALVSKEYGLRYSDIERWKVKLYS